MLLNTAPTDAILADLALHGKVRDVVPAINAVTLQAKSSELAAIRALPYVTAANPDQERNDRPINHTAGRLTSPTAFPPGTWMRST